MSKICAWLAMATLMVMVAAAPVAAQASEPLKPYVVFIMDTSGSMDTATNSGPTSCGFPDTKRDHAKCAINNIVNSYGDMVFALGRFRMAMSGTFPSCTLTGPGTQGTSTCNGSDDMFELLTPLVDGNNELAARWTDGTINTCNASGTDPEIWETVGNTPIAGSLVGVRDYWLGNQATNQTIWPAAAGLVGGYDPITADTTNTAFLARPGTGTSTCDANRATCIDTAGCTGANCCCLEQCRPYIVIMLTDGDETCTAFDPNATDAAAALLATDKAVGGVTRRYRIETKAIGFGKPAPDPEIEDLAHFGGAADDLNDTTTEGYYAQNEAELQLAISEILADAIRTEVCNGLDDDCDTIADEGFTTGTTCNNGRLGQCLVPGATACRADGAGTQCSAGRTPTCAGAANGTPCMVTNAASALVAGTCQASICQPIAAGTPGAADNEVPFSCNDIDDDCDGLVDENVPGCVCIPFAEVCDGDDDDCDGNIDEGTEVPCSNGTCLGVIPCNGVAGPGTCTAPPSPLPEEQCNGLDDNCDGNADGFQETCSNMTCPGGACTGGVAGQRTCVGGARDGKRCDTFAALDPRNNPGGNPGSACEALGAQCICNPGNHTCPLNGGGVFSACVQEIEPGTEVCNNLDDDCDGLIDEAPPVTCTTSADCPAITPTCDNPSSMANMGTCQPADCSINSCGGELLCVNGVQMCTQTAGIDDTCNGLDEDCDGMVDEGWVCADPDGPDNMVGTPDDCACTVSGQCGATEACQNGSPVCMGDPVAQESCNCADDDCDDLVDEGSLCGTGATCTNCQCAFACSPGEFPCPMGKTCLNNFCIADPCFNNGCPDVPGVKQICRPLASNPSIRECVSACDASVITCNAPNICFAPSGECKPNDCTTFPDMCQANQNCINGTCVTNPCQGVTCPSDQYCVAGTCFGSCADVECPTGQRCRMGMCVEDPCGAPCPTGQVCDEDDQECVPDPCQFVTCPVGQYCNAARGGVCEDDPCVGTTCPNPGEVCRGGTCYDPGDFLPDAAVEIQVTTGGGGGCRTTRSSGGSFVLLLGALAFGIRRRRNGGAA